MDFLLSCAACATLLILLWCFSNKSSRYCRSNAFTTRSFAALKSRSSAVSRNTRLFVGRIGSGKSSGRMVSLVATERMGAVCFNSAIQSLDYLAWLVLGTKEKRIFIQFLWFRDSVPDFWHYSAFNGFSVGIQVQSLPVGATDEYYRRAFRLC